MEDETIVIGDGKTEEFASIEHALAMGLLRGKGLSHSAFTREYLGKETIDNKDKSETREAFDEILAFVKKEHGDAIYKDGHVHLLKEPESEEVKALKAKITELEAELEELKAKPKVVVEVSAGGRTWRYNHKTGASKQFAVAEAAQLGDEWKSYPKG
jgi:hypothetical protein